MKQRIFCSTLDLRDGGGVLSLVKAFNNSLKSRYDIKYFFPSRDRTDHITLKKTIKINCTIRNTDFIFEELKCLSFGTFFPEFEFLNYLTAIKLYKKETKNYDFYMAISGFNHSAIPFVLLNLPFIVWIASTFQEDRSRRIKTIPFRGKVYDLFSSPVVKYYEKLIFERSSKVIVTSSYTRNMILSKYPNIESSKLIVIPYPIEAKYCSPKTASNKKIIFIARYHDPRKNLYMLLKAFSIVVKYDPTVKLILSGGVVTKEIQEKVRQLQIEEKIDFYGYIAEEEKLALLRDSYLFVIPSFQEGLCIAGLEAMACGLPIVSTFCGGPEDFVVQNETGLLVENDNPEKFAEAVIEMIKDSEKTARMGEKARQLVIEKYSWQEFNSQFLNVLGEVYGSCET